MPSTIFCFCWLVWVSLLITWEGGHIVFWEAFGRFMLIRPTWCHFEHHDVILKVNTSASNWAKDTTQLLFCCLPHKQILDLFQVASPTCDERRICQMGKGRQPDNLTKFTRSWERHMSLLPHHLLPPFFFSVPDPGFPRWWCQHTIWSIFPKNCIKIKKFWPKRGACAHRAPLDLQLLVFFRIPLPSPNYY